MTNESVTRAGSRSEEHDHERSQHRLATRGSQENADEVGIGTPYAGVTCPNLMKSCVHDIPMLRRNFEVSRDMVPIRCSHGA